MNKQRRKQLQEIVDKISELKEHLDFLIEEEQEAFENLPGGIQSSDRGTKMENKISEMEYISSDLEDLSMRLVEL